MSEADLQKGFSKANFNTII